MKKIVFPAVSFLISFVILFTIFYKKTESNGSIIAIFVPAQHPAMDEIVAGFCDSLKQRMPLMQFRIYNGQGNKALMQSQAEMIVSSSRDLVFTIGNLSSQHICTVLF